MSDNAIFIIGIVIFAITVYGTVMAGGIALTRSQLEQNPALQDRVDKKDLKKRFPFRIKY
jgi:hypothetical protein